MNSKSTFSTLLLSLVLAGAHFPTVARDGVEVGGNSKFSKLVPAEQVEASAQQQYYQMLNQASQKRRWLPPPIRSL